MALFLKTLRRLVASTLATAIFFAAGLAAHAADSYWSGSAGTSGTGAWGTSGNWSNGVPTSTDTRSFLIRCLGRATM